MDTINLKRFDINIVKKNSVCIIIGKRSTGKTTLVKDLIYNNHNIKNVPDVNLFVPSELYKTKNEYSLSDNNTYHIYSSELLENITKTLRNNCKKNLVKESLSIFDDCILKSNDKSVKDIFINGGHHFKMTTILTITHPLDLSNQLISCTEYVFIFKNDVNSSRRNIYDKYARFLPTFEIFNDIFDSLDDYECLVISPYSTNNIYEYPIFWYKANVNQEKNNKRKFENTNVDHESNKKDCVEEINNKRKYQDIQDKNTEKTNEITKKVKIFKEINYYNDTFNILVDNGIGGFRFSD